MQTFIYFVSNSVSEKKMQLNWTLKNLGTILVSTEHYFDSLWAVEVIIVITTSGSISREKENLQMRKIILSNKKVIRKKGKEQIEKMVQQKYSVCVHIIWKYLFIIVFLLLSEVLNALWVLLITYYFVMLYAFIIYNVYNYYLLKNALY